MKLINSTAGILGAGLLIASLFITQPFRRRESFLRNEPVDGSSPVYQTPNSNRFSATSENGALSSQVQDITFSRLKVEAAEKQAKGSIKEELAIKARERVFTNSESWHAFWSPHVDGKVPQVDFNVNQVAAVFLGAKPNPGYGVEISKISYDPRKKLTVIHVVELLPDPEMSYLAVIVYPSDIVVFPAQPGKVHFERTQRVRAE